MNGIDLMQTPYNEICEITASLGYPAFRAKQIYGWAMKGTPVDEMSNLPAELRKKLTDSGCFVFLPEIKKKLVSAERHRREDLEHRHDGDRRAA